MTRLFNDPARFVDEAIEGFVAANRSTIAPVWGGVVRREERDNGVAVVIGGGSGHYPAFAGLVGLGLAHGAAIGNVFASPAAQQICSVARNVDRGSGILFAFGNYTGDLLNFTAAMQQLEAEGIACRSVAVTDDIASAPAERTSMRRGIAGGMIVYKMAGRAADEGRPLDEVTRIAELANARTRSLGVAMSGCTLPGSDTPLFSLAHGRMSVGMGVHGEPGIFERNQPSADELAEIFVSRLLSDVPAEVTVDGASAAVVLNGLGAIKYEELFVVYRRVDELLRQASVTLVEPEVGEFTTSFDMAGVSLTICWLSDELTELWRAPADAPAFRKSESRRESVQDQVDALSLAADPIPTGSYESQAAARTVLGALKVVRAVLDEESDALGRLDAVAGDGDHGIGMKRGSAAATRAAGAAVLAGGGAGSALAHAGNAWASAGGGTSGMLWGVLLTCIGREVGDVEKVTAQRFCTGVNRGVEEVQRVGKASVGDKSMVDALVPFATTLQERVEQGSSLVTAWEAGSLAATDAASTTSDLIPNVGRARPLAQRSLGSPDPGAVSLALVLTAVADYLTSKREADQKTGE